MTNYSRSVLKSNGLHRSKNLPVKFGFSPRTVPANIVKKLPSQRCSKPLFIAFSTSLTNGPHSLSQAKAGTHSAFGEGSHTAAHTAKQGALRMGVVSLLSERSARSPTSPGRVSERQVLPLLGLGRGCSQKTQRACGTAMRLCVSLSRRRRGPAGLRDLFLLLSKLWLVRPALRAFCVYEAWVVSLPSVCFASCRNAGRPLVKAANLPFSCVPYLHL